MKRFALIGAAGYIAPRHLKAIKDSGGILVAALDPFDSVGVMDSYFPQAEFFTQPEVFEQHLYDLRRQKQRVEFVSICSPNYLHDAHIRLALRVGADALCEKPIVLNPEDITALKEIEVETGQRVWTILQLRAHPALIKLKEQLDDVTDTLVRDVDLTYITGRGTWYQRSWKGHVEQSGGLATNIGVHFFDMLTWMFGNIKSVEVHIRTETACAGYLELERARVRWYLSVNAEDVPTSLQSKGQRTYRSIIINGQELEFSEGFSDLHTAVYQRTLKGHGFTLDDTYQAIVTVAQIRNLTIVSPSDSTVHPFVSRPTTPNIVRF